MKTLTIDELNQVSGGNGWWSRYAAEHGINTGGDSNSVSGNNRYSSPNDPCRDSTTDFTRGVCEFTRDLGKYHDNVVNSLTDIMCRVTGTC